MSEFNLSDKIGDVRDEWDMALRTKDVKEFIKNLKESANVIYSKDQPTKNVVLNIDVIDKLAGDKLI